LASLLPIFKLRKRRTKSAVFLMVIRTLGT
jgi:hypothetical protein